MGRATGCTKCCIFVSRLLSTYTRCRPNRSLRAQGHRENVWRVSRTLTRHQFRPCQYRLGLPNVLDLSTNRRDIHAQTLPVQPPILLTMMTSGSVKAAVLSSVTPISSPRSLLESRRLALQWSRVNMLAPTRHLPRAWGQLSRKLAGWRAGKSPTWPVSLQKPLQLAHPVC